MPSVYTEALFSGQAVAGIVSSVAAIISTRVTKKTIQCFPNKCLKMKSFQINIVVF